MCYCNDVYYYIDLIKYLLQLIHNQVESKDNLNTFNCVKLEN